MDVTGLLMDPGITIAVQNFSPALTLFISRGEFLDSTAWYLLIISVLFLGFGPRCGIRLAVLVGITAGLNEALKLARHLPRPYWISPEVNVFTHHPSLGFPSGGAMYGAVIYGYIAAVIRQCWAVPACAFLLVSMCLVRVFAGAHFALDVFGGLLFGFLLIFLFFLARPRAERFTGSLSRGSRFAGIIMLSLLPILIVIPAYLPLAGWQLPASWAGTQPACRSHRKLPRSPSFMHGVQRVSSWGALPGMKFFSRWGDGHPRQIPGEMGWLSLQGLPRCSC